MQPLPRPGRPGRMPPTRRVARTLLVLALALVATAVPIRQVAACSCMAFGSPEELVAAHEVTFIGTVVDTAPGEGGGIGGRNVLYAFDVERASEATDAVLAVQAVDDDGGASCGFAFGVGERWLVAAYRQGAQLETSLCSGNQLAGDMAADELATYADLLPNVPPEPADPANEPAGQSDVSIPVAVALGGLAVLGLAAAMLFAFRERRVRPD